MNKISYILLLAISIFAVNSCQNDIEGTKDLNYVTFEKSPDNVITIEKNTTVNYDAHVYTTQKTSSARTFNVTVSAATTLNSNSFIVPATVTIPANSNDGVLKISFSDTNLGENIEMLVLQLKAETGVFMGGKFTLLVQKKCSLTNGINDLVGTYSVSTNDDGYENAISAAASGNDLIITGLGQDFITYFWGETVIAGGTCTMTINPNTGALNIPRQYIFTTDYGGIAYDYEIQGSGTWGNCGAKPTLTITYDIYYVGDADGLAKTYASYLPNAYLNGTFTLN